MVRRASQKAHGTGSGGRPASPFCPLARRVIAADDAVDYDFNAIKHTLAQEIAADPAKVDAALDLLMVIKYLERIGDHAVNVAEWVQFVRTGRYKDESMF